MANTDAARGFVPVGHTTGGEIRCRSYQKEDAGNIYKGDVVSLGSNGMAVAATAADNYLAIGVAAESIEGGDDDFILIWDDPDILYEVQGYSSITFTKNMVGEYAPHVANSADTTYMISRQELNTPGDKGGQFIIVGKVDRPGNDWGEHVKLLVKFSQHKFRAAVAAT